MIPPVASSSFTLIFAMGIATCIATLHAWLWQRGRAESQHLWVAGWSAASVVLQLGRYVQLGTTDPDVAVAAARTAVAMVPMLVLTLVGFARALGGHPDEIGFRRGFVAMNSLLSVLAIATPLFLSGETGMRTDWFGRPHISVPATPALVLFLPYSVGALWYALREIGLSRGLERWERRLLIGTLVAYAALGIQSLLSAMQLVAQPLLIEYAPLVVAFGLHFLLANRHRRLQHGLEQRVEQRTREIADANTRLAESESRYRRLVDDAPLCIVACDRDGRVVASNPHLRRVIGAPTEGAVRAINVLEDDNLVEAGISRIVRRCLETGESSIAEVSFTSRWKETVEIRVHVAAVRDAEGFVTGAQAMAEDVADRRRLEEQLRQSQKVEAVGRLAAGIAHEINNPMAYVRSNLGLLRQRWDEIRAAIAKLPPEARRDADVAECEELIDESLEGVDRTIAIVRDVKDFSRTAQGGREEADVNELLEESLRIAAPQLHDGIRVERDLCPSASVCGAPSQLLQVFLNLVVNAAQAIEGEGSIRLTTRANDGEVVLRIADTGCGIPADVREHLFDPFFTTKPAGQGTGLGLYIAHEIVRIHGGEIRVESKPSAGSTFEVRLPA